ncbi:MAG: FxsA family protein [Acidimicrobiales bacterium]
MAWLALFLLLPLAELWVVVQVAGQIGAVEAVLLLIAVSMVGVWLVKREGVGVWRRLQAQLPRGQLPQTEVVDGFLLLAAGVLLVVPGFLTDIVAAFILVAPTRALFRRLVVSWVARRPVTRRVVFIGDRVATDTGDVIDVDSSEAASTRSVIGELGRQ